MEYVEKLAQHARDMDKPWPPQAKNTVRRLGERLSQVIWKGRQWAVTTYGLEERAGLYHVQRNRLWKGEDDYGWVRHMSEKGWIDLADFAEALRIARSVHSPKRRREASNGAELLRRPKHSGQFFLCSHLVSEFLNVKSESISDDLVMRVISGSDDAVADLRAQLLFNGYVPLPASEKGVYLENWSKLDDNGRQRGVQPDIEMIDSWTAKHPQWQSTSVRCGEVVAIDCDVLDKVVADKIRDEARRCFGKAFPTRVGRPPKFLMMCRTAEPFSKLYTDKYVQPDGGESRVEVLCNGQQFIAYGIHPKTGKPYEWFGGEPEKTPVADLPEVSRGQIVAFLRAAEEILSAQPNWTLDPKAARGNYETREREEPKHDYSVAPPDWAKLERALDTLTDVSDYETYYRIVAALHDGTDDRKRARALAFRWAAGYPDMFDPAGLQKKWDSFKRGSGVGLGTIFHLAREAEAQNPWFKDGEYEYAQGQDGGPLETSVASSYTMRGIQWLWLDRFAIGKLGLIGGLPDKGKGLISCDLIACVTANKALPCKEGHVPQGNVIWLTAEDDIEDTIIPRLTAAGADLDKVHIVRMMRDGGKRRMFSLVTDLEALRSKIEAVGDVVLVIIDPVSAYVGIGKVNNSMTTDVRGFLTPLTDLAAEMRLFVLGIMHFNKKADVTNAMLRIADSLAYVAAARHVYVVVDNPKVEGSRVFVKAKNNLSPDTRALTYTTEARKVGVDEETGEEIRAP